MPTPKEMPNKTPVKVSNELLTAGMTTWHRIETQSSVSYKRDEILRKAVPSGACHGLHFIAGNEEGKKVICYARCASSYVTATKR